MHKFSFYSLQVSILLLQTKSNIIQPKYSVKVFNTDKVIFSLGDDDDTNYDLEIIRNHPENTLLEKKLYDFHKYINLAEKTERPKEREFQPYKRFQKKMLLPPVQYPDSPYEIASNEKDLSVLERRKWKTKRVRRRKRRKKKKKHKMKQTGEDEFRREESDRKKEGTTFTDDEDTEEEYDDMEKEYWDYLIKSHSGFKYSDKGKPEETVKDVFFKILDVRTPENCTNVTGIGVQAVECLIKNYQDGVFNKKEMIYGLLSILLIWIYIYLAIALPLWCCKGWCCCCCRCSFCFPKKTVRDIRDYIFRNPPGVINNCLGNIECYNPSEREKELFETLKRSIAEF